MINTLPKKLLINLVFALTSLILWDYIFITEETIRVVGLNVLMAIWMFIMIITGVRSIKWD